MLKKFVLGGMTALVLAACGGEGGSASSSAPAQSAGASGSLIERINNKGTITVGTEGTYAPFTLPRQRRQADRLRCGSHPRRCGKIGRKSRI